jgi:hypothetical protein
VRKWTAVPREGCVDRGEISWPIWLEVWWGASGEGVLNWRSCPYLHMMVRRLVRLGSLA